MMQFFTGSTSIPLSSRQHTSLQPLQERAVVTKTEGDYVWVSVVDKPGGCDGCASKSACGSFNLFKPLIDESVAKNNNNIKIRNTLNVDKGQEILIEISSQSLLKSTFLVYLLPLLILFAGAVIGKQLGGELVSTVLGILGLILGLFIVKIMLSKTTFKQRLEPMMVIPD